MGARATPLDIFSKYAYITLASKRRGFAQSTVIFVSKQERSTAYRIEEFCFNRSPYHSSPNQQGDSP